MNVKEWMDAVDELGFSPKDFEREKIDHIIKFILWFVGSEWDQLAAIRLGLVDR